jgi:Uma2 family endonuclease
MHEVTPLIEPAEIVEFPTDLPEEDGIPLESNWHRIQINLLVELVHQLWQALTNYFAGGNMFVYFSTRQLTTHNYRGPDFFVVKDVEPRPDRRSWKIWEEDGRFPDVIVELLSPSTANTDLTTKKRLYERTFRTPEYFAYDPDSRRLRGWRLEKRGYRALKPNEHGWLWSEELGVWLGEWQGEYERAQAVWLRFYTADGHLVPTGEEAQAAARREAEARAAQTEARAAQEAIARREAEAELARLRDELARLRGENN